MELFMTVVLYFTTVFLLKSNRVGGVVDKPNIIILLADDLGYADLYNTGHPTQERNEIDQMAEEGLKLMNFYAGSSVCTPSRAAMMTGRFAFRNGIYGTPTVFLCSSTLGLPRSEYTIAEGLRDAGYQTGFVGKWHLGWNHEDPDDCYYAPVHHGFDYVGLTLPMGNLWECDESYVHRKRGPSPTQCYLYENTTIIQQPMNHTNLSERLTEETIEFIERNKNESFFFLFSHPQPHVSLYASEKFKGKSRRGFYGDNVNEMAWSFGQVINKLKETGLDKNTLVLFASDNGPQAELCLESGDAGMFSGGKSSTWEGGLRVPAIAWWPGQIPADTVTYELVSLVDLMPTFIDIAGGSVEPVAGKKHDGLSVKDVLLNGGRSPHDYYFIYYGSDLLAVRHGPYKVVFERKRTPSVEQLILLCPEGIPNTDAGLTTTTDYNVIVYNVETDPREYYPITVGVDDVLLRVQQAVEIELSTNYIPETIMRTADCNVLPCCEPPHCICNYNGDHYYPYYCDADIL